MSPLQRWMREHNHPGWYSWLVVVGGNLLTLTLTIVVVMSINQRSIERERASRQASERALCGFVAAYTQSDEAPATDYGKNIQASIVNLGRILHCEGL